MPLHAHSKNFEDNTFPFELSDGKNIDGYYWGSRLPASVEFINKARMCGFYWDDEKTIFKYKLERLAGPGDG
jgi:hypothetical protein